MRHTTVIAIAAIALSLSQARSETLPLPDGLIAFDSDEGEALLIGAEARSDFFPLSSHFTNQINPAFCGPASISMILNALGLPRPASDLTLGLGLFDQENIFTPATEAVKLKAHILRGGMTLDEFGRVLAAYGLKVEVQHAADSGLDAFREAAVAALEDQEHFVVVNYLRKAGHRPGGGWPYLAARRLRRRHRSLPHPRCHPLQVPANLGFGVGAFRRDEHRGQRQP